MKKLLKVFVVLLLCNGSIAFSDSGTCNLKLAYRPTGDALPNGVADTLIAAMSADLITYSEHSLTTNRDRCYEIFNSSQPLAEAGIIMVSIGSVYVHGLSKVEWVRDESL